MTKNNNVFERYYKIESEDARMVYQSNRGQVIPMKKKRVKTDPILTLLFRPSKMTLYL